MGSNSELAITLKLVSDQLTSGLSDARKSVKDFGTSLATMAAPLAGIGVAMGGVVMKAANFGDQLSKASQRVGVAVEDLAALQYAAQLADVSNEQLGTGLGKLAKNMKDAADGNKEAEDTFKSLGVSVTGQDGALRSVRDVMEELAGKFSDMEDGTQKTAVAMEVFGKSGKELIPLLNAGKEGLRESAEEAANLGVVIGKDAAVASEQFNDNLTRLNKLFEGLIVQLGIHFIPALNAMAEAVKPIILGISDWAKAHPELMEGLMAVAGVLGAGGVVAVAVAAFGTLLAGMAVVGGPILLVSAGIAAIIGALVAFRKEIAAAYNAVKGFINDGLGAADRFISTMAAGLETKLVGIAKVAEKIATAVARFLKPGSPTEEGPWSDLDQWGKRFVDTLAGGIDERTSDLARAAGATAQTAAERAQNELDIRGTIPMRIEDSRFSTSIRRTGTSFGAGMAESFDAFVKRSQDAFAQGVQMADAAAQAMARGFETFFFKIMDGKIRTLKDAFNAFLDFTKSLVQAVIQELIRIAAVKMVASFLGGFAVGAHEGGQIVKAAQGGQIRRYSLGGPVFGFGNEDNVPALLTPGEYVLSRRGVDFLDRVNDGRAPLTATPMPAIVNDIKIDVHNKIADAEVQTYQRRGAGGSTVIEFVIQKVGQAIQGGRYDREFSGSFGLQRVATAR